MKTMKVALLTSALTAILGLTGCVGDADTPDGDLGEVTDELMCSDCIEDGGGFDSLYQPTGQSFTEEALIWQVYDCHWGETMCHIGCVAHFPSGYKWLGCGTLGCYCAVPV